MTRLSLYKPLQRLEQPNFAAASLRRPCPEHHEVSFVLLQPARQLAPPWPLAARRITSCSICLKALSEAVPPGTSAGIDQGLDRSEVFLVWWFLLFAKGFSWLVQFSKLARLPCGR